MAHKLKELHGDSVDFIFMDTGAEHPATYEFIQKCDSAFGLNLVCLRGDFNQPLGKSPDYTVVPVDSLSDDYGPFREMMRKYGTPTVKGAWCTSRMKQEIHDKYCDATYGKDGYATWIGIRADEPNRLKNVGKSPRIRYLAEISDWDKDEILEWWSEQPFDLNIPEHLGNCVFCVKKSVAKLVRAAQECPEILAKFEAAIETANPRPDLDRPAPKEVMFRGHNTLASLAAQGGASSQEHVGRFTDPDNACSESCEVFGDL